MPTVTQIQLNPVRSPCRDAAAEKILILSPYRAIKQQGSRYYRPVRYVPDHPLSRRRLILFIQTSVNNLNQKNQLVKNRQPCRYIEPPRSRDQRKVSSGIVQTYVRRIKAHKIFILFKKAADANTKHRPDENIRVQHHALRFHHLFCSARQRLKSVATSSSEIPFSARISCHRLAASRRAARSVSLRVRAAGMKEPMV